MHPPFRDEHHLSRMLDAIVSVISDLILPFWLGIQPSDPIRARDVLIIGPIPSGTPLDCVVILPTRVIPENPSLLPENDYVPRLPVMMEGEALQVRSDRYGKVIPPKFAVGSCPDLLLLRRSVDRSRLGILEVGARGHGKWMTILEHPLRDCNFTIEEILQRIVHVLRDELLSVKNPIS